MCVKCTVIAILYCFDFALKLACRDVCTLEHVHFPAVAVRHVLVINIRIGVMRLELDVLYF